MKMTPPSLEGSGCDRGGHSWGLEGGIEMYVCGERIIKLGESGEWVPINFFPALLEELLPWCVQSIQTLRITSVQC